ncbi:PAS domain S-box protein [Natronogracilivirga saccharolytica]|uniref:Sensor protein FixL n=1 Tax=Natronogracilivirga saccharolytica TaxID=2812953 RepID=A0A8J7UTX5_9BACT|nr:PAS domain S-box protein [Natronogracilivirga saccharolytica]MBP3191810.1 PAS domain S-box protein [Natronogracilivirga saccharolytica]
MKTCNNQLKIPDQRSRQSLTGSEFLTRQQDTIATLSDFFLRHEEDERVYGMLSRLVRDVLQVDGCLVLQRIPESNQVRLYSACGFCEMDKLETTNWIENPHLQTTMDSSGVIAVSDFSESEVYYPPDRECFREFRSSMSTRIPGEDSASGVLAVYDRNKKNFLQHEQDFLKTIANMLAGKLARDAKDRELKKSESRSKAILDTAVDGIITIDANGNIGLFNKAAQEVFGYREDEVIGKNVSMLMPEPFRSEHDRYIEQYSSTGQKRIIGSSREVTGLRKDGTTFPLYLAVSEFHIDNKRHFTGIVRDITEQRSLEQEVLNTSDHERRRIGQDLHDGLGQMLTGIGLMSQSLKNRLKNEHSEAAEQAEEITRLIKDADQYARNLSRGLLPVDFEVRGLVTSLERLAQNAERLFGVTCTFKEKNAPVFHDNSAVEHLFRIAQEAISNAVKHGLADSVLLDLDADNHAAELGISDNGKGFSPNWQDKKGSGLDIMQFRARLIGATLDIQHFDNGTRIVCKIPASESSYSLDSAGAETS